MINMKCDVCGEGTLRLSQRERKIEYAGSVGNVLLHFSKCDVCCSEITNEEQSVLNRQAVIRFKKIVDGVPLGVQIRAMRKAARLTQAEAGALLGGGPVAFSKYERDDLIPDAGMATLLRLLISDPSLIDQIRAQKSATSVATKKTLEAVHHSDPSSTWTFSHDLDDEVDVITPVAVETREPYAQSADSPWGPH